MSDKTLFQKSFPTVKISAKTGRNIDTLLDNIYKKLPEGDLLYPEDVLTEESMRDVASEIIREKMPNFATYYAKSENKQVKFFI